MTTPTTPAPTQVVHPWKAALRTALQTFVAFAAIAGLAAPLVSDFVAQFWPGSPVIGWIGVGAAFVGALAGLLSRLAALPGVNAFLTSIGLGAQPKHAE